jgi:predicted ester cyclase
VAGVASGGAGMREAFAELHEQFPDVRAEVESLVAEGENGGRARHVQRHAGGESERIYWPEMIFTRFTEGRAVESWEVTDTGRTWTSPPW